MEILAADLQAVRGASSDGAVNLLPQFDPYLLGHASRDHLFDREHASRVSRTAGWISAVVVAGGAVVGTWKHTAGRRGLLVAVTPFKTLQARVKRDVRRRAEELAASLGAGSVEVAFD
jgi:hypothetical protein